MKLEMLDNEKEDVRYVSTSRSYTSPFFAGIRQRLDRCLICGNFLKDTIYTCDACWRPLSKSEQDRIIAEVQKRPEGSKFTMFKYWVRK